MESYTIDNHHKQEPTCDHILRIKQEKLANYIRKISTVKISSDDIKQRKCWICLHCGKITKDNKKRLLNSSKEETKEQHYCSSHFIENDKHCLHIDIINEEVVCEICEINITKLIKSKNATTLKGERLLKQFKEESGEKDNKVIKVEERHDKIMELLKKSQPIYLKDDIDVGGKFEKDEKETVVDDIDGDDDKELSEQELSKRNIVKAKNNVNKNYHHYNNDYDNNNKSITELKVFGLKNLGNTCFFNSIMQCLYATLDLHTALNTELRYKKAYRAETTTNQTELSRIDLLHSFYKFLQTESHSTFNPKSIFSFIGSTKAVFKRMEQQDAHEALCILINLLVDDNLSKKEKEEEIRQYEEFVVNSGSLAKNMNKIENVFEIILAGKLKCLKCQKVSWNTERNFEINVHLESSKPSNNNKKFNNGNNNNNKNNNKNNNDFEPENNTIEINPEEFVNGEKGWYYPESSLESITKTILSGFFETESLNKNNYFECEFCHESEAIKKYYVKHSPENLIVALKRFHNNGFKNCAKVNFKEYIVLEPYTLVSKNEENMNKKSLRYQLYAISVHSGTARGGHYVAYTKRSKDWYYFSDSSYKEIKWEKVLHAEPYILFYKRVNELIEE